MKFQGVIDKITATLDNKWLYLTFKLPYRVALENRTKSLAGMELDIEFDKHKESKTDKQRKYFWALVRELRKAIKDGITEDDIYLDILRNDGISDWVALPLEQLYIAKNYYKIVEDKGQTILKTPSGKEVSMRQLRCWKGLHNYTVDEACLLIDGAIQECKEHGIPTDTPDEIARMKQEWGVKIG